MQQSSLETRLQCPRERRSSGAARCWEPICPAKMPSGHGLDSYYEDWLNTFDLCPVLTIHSDDLNFVRKPRHLDRVLERINEKLAGRDEMVLE